MKLKDRVAIITGNSKGIGREESYLFAREGAIIIGADIDDDGAEETAEIVRSSGGKAVYIHTDVTKIAEVEKLIKAVIEKYGKIDILINNAGIPQEPTPIEDIEESLWDRVHDVNVKSVFLTAKYAVPYMKKANKGVIINTSTMNSIRPQIYHCALAPAKNSLLALTKAMALELAPHNIRVNCISPWTVDTPSFQASLSEEEKQQWIDLTPLGRIGKPEDIANAALYLVSDDSSWVTGVNLEVDGGYGI
jgi:3-oxoacyl-[acyl-carrier protein] reductase